MQLVQFYGDVLLNVLILMSCFVKFGLKFNLIFSKTCHFKVIIFRCLERTSSFTKVHAKTLPDNRTHPLVRLGRYYNITLTTMLQQTKARCLRSSLVGFSALRVTSDMFYCRGGQSVHLPQNIFLCSAKKTLLKALWNKLDA